MTMPKDMPGDAGQAYARLSGVTRPTLDDLKLMVLLEASGQAFYSGLAQAAPEGEVRALLEKNGQEELGHAHRVSHVIEHLFKERFPVPAPADNPYYQVPQGLALDPGLLEGIAAGEFGGEALYESWAVSLADDTAAKLLRQNGKEETRHGERIKEILARL